MKKIQGKEKDKEAKDTKETKEGTGDPQLPQSISLGNLPTLPPNILSNLPPECQEEMEAFKEKLSQAEREIKAYLSSKKPNPEQETEVRGEDMLGELHGLVATLTEEMEMTEEQEEDYQRMMGGLDEGFKTLQNRLGEARERANRAEGSLAEMELKLEDWEERGRGLEEQNKLLRKSALSSLEEQKEQRNHDGLEMAKLKEEIEQLKKDAEERGSDVSKLEDKLRLAGEEIAHFEGMEKTHKEEMEALAKKLQTSMTDFSTLESKYRYLKEKYAQASSGVIKKYETRYKDKEKELIEKYEKKYEHKEKEILEDPAELAESMISCQTEKSEGGVVKLTSQETSELEEKVKKLEEELELVKKDLEDVLTESRRKDEDILQLESKLTELSKKRLSSASKEDNNKVASAEKKPEQDFPKSDKPEKPLINPVRLLKYTSSMYDELREVYKLFLLATVEAGKQSEVEEVQLKINGLVEKTNDFREYVQLKTKAS